MKKGGVAVTHTHGKEQLRPGEAIGAIFPPKTCGSNFIHNNFLQFQKQHLRYTPFCRPFFCHSSVEKHTLFLLLQWRSFYETWLRNINETDHPSHLTGWTRPYVRLNKQRKTSELAWLDFVVFFSLVQLNDRLGCLRGSVQWNSM